MTGDSLHKSRHHHRWVLEDRIRKYRLEDLYQLVGVYFWLFLIQK